MVDYRKYYERKKGIRLRKDWDVHHLDFNRENNDIENLYAMPKVMHQYIHRHWGKSEIDELNDEMRKWVKSFNCLKLDGRDIKNPNRLPNRDLPEEQTKKKDGEQMNLF